MTPNQSNGNLQAVSIILPYAFQAFVLLLMTVIVLVHDGISTDAAIQALVIIGSGNALAGGVTSAVSILAKGKLDTTKVQAFAKTDGDK